ncbi:MAG TPA: 1-(5-phosphoribosyl)-5-[(5-phosphoribosylamino)methylideneamino] imidazole-4-carboxamide isomerase [Gaiellaceae bacterium]|jgi:phosphoribosylformimino-5-aminoimidazole carboxamide ribotide isomerase
MARDRLLVIPAVDVLGDEAVRLEQGDFGRVAEHAGDPLALVRRFAAAGPPLLHLVDLAGARYGRVRPELVAAAVETAGAVPVQASGGIRSVADAEALLAAGAARVVVGTAAFAGGLDRFADALGERLVVAIDVSGGRVAVRGWAERTDLTAEEAAVRCASAGVARVLCTAVERDGTLGGPDLDLIARVQEHAGAPVLAAGGIRSEDDLDRLAMLGVEGAVVGRALLSGTLRL